MTKGAAPTQAFAGMTIETALKKSVIPAEAGIHLQLQARGDGSQGRQTRPNPWVPASAGMTEGVARIPAFAGMTKKAQVSAFGAMTIMIRRRLPHRTLPCVHACNSFS